MTPLAHQLAKQLTFPLKLRTGYWAECGSSLTDILTDVHCFEVTNALTMSMQIAEAASAITDDPAKQATLFAKRSFLPAPKTWLECMWGIGRVAVLLEQQDNQLSSIKMIWPQGEFDLGHISTAAKAWIPSNLRGDMPIDWAHRGTVSIARGIIHHVYNFLYIINSPKIIGRKQHMPHRGLERALLKSTGVVGRYPLHAWSEILLEARATFIDDTGVEREAHFTGRKCLHFCRAYVRERDGKLEFIGSHWKGDPVLGLKRKRYKVVPPRNLNERIDL